jgi:hypothetical protein
VTEHCGQEAFVAKQRLPRQVGVVTGDGVEHPLGVRGCDSSLDGTSGLSTGN